MSSAPPAPVEENPMGYAAPGTRLTLRLPDDFHHHARDGVPTAHILAHASKRFGRCLMMPNLVPPITTTEEALKYKEHILGSLPAKTTAEGDNDSTSSYTTATMQPLMTLYLTDRTTAEEITKAAQAGIVAVKYYPAGATTNSEHGVTDIRHCYDALETLAQHNMMLCIHSEVTDASVDIFDREPVFIETVVKPLVRDFPTLKITMEHISTKKAVDYVLNEAPDTVKASITCHHLLYNRNRKYGSVLL
jgi:dihydroorotase